MENMIRLNIPLHAKNRPNGRLIVTKSIRFYGSATIRLFFLLLSGYIPHVQVVTTSTASS